MADETDAVEEQVEEGQKACDFALEIDGQRVDGILAVRGLVAFRLDVRTTTAIRKLQEPLKSRAWCSRTRSTPATSG